MKPGVLLVFFLAPLLVLAQPTEITGNITDAGDGSVLPGANVLSLPSRTGATTDMDGNYRLRPEPGDDSIRVSFIGYRTQSLPINNRSNIDVALREDASVLEELVVVGYGVQRKSDLTGAVSSIKAEEMVTVPAASPLQALQGKVAGLTVTNSSGAPGDRPVVRIRGVGTISGNASPIYVVDGVILNDVQFLSPHDIESVEVLKDASATAIYGSRGANGVVMITTKTGKEGKPVINFSYEYGQQYIPKHIDLLTGKEFAGYVNVINPGTYNNLDRVPNVDWQEEVFREYAPLHNANFSISGASDKSSYYFALGLYDQEGILPKSSYQRVTVKLNNDYEISERVRFGNRITVSPEQRVNPAGVIGNVYRAWPTLEPYNPDGSFAEIFGGGNPLAAIEYTNSNSEVLRSVGNIFGEIDILEDLTFRSSFGYDVSNTENVGFTPVYFVSPQQQSERSSVSNILNEQRNWLWEQTLTYSKEFDKHRLNLLAGYTSQEDHFEIRGGTARELIDEDPSMWYLSTGNTELFNVVHGANSNRILSSLFRVNYTFDERYLFTASFRRDGSTKFGPNYRYGNFPSFAAGWNIFQENFMQNADFLTNLKLRASWGKVGNEKIPWSAQYSLVSQAYNAVFGINEQLLQGATYSTAGNPDLRWETTEQTDIGLEFGLLNGKLRGELDYYRRVTSDALVPLPTPGHLGNGPFALVFFNVGDILNQGMEFNITWSDQIADFGYSLTALGASVHNEVLTISETGGGGDALIGGSLGNGQNVTNTRVGDPVGAFYGYNVIGVFQTQEEVESNATFGTQEPGDLRFEDVNNDGIIDDEDRVVLGSYIPDFTYGFQMDFLYKGLGLNLDFYGVYGNEIYNGKDAVRPDLYNFEASRTDYWDGPGTSETEPRPTAGGVNYEPSSYFVQDASFFRLRTVTLSYNLPKKWISPALLQSARLYVRGTNVFTLSEYTGYTPELASEDVRSSGIDLGVYPLTSIYSLGVNLSF